MITGDEILVARGVLGWSIPQLARQASVSVRQVQQAEDETLSLPDLGILARLEAALEAAGVEFIPENGGGAGVRLKKPSP